MDKVFVIKLKKSSTTYSIGEEFTTTNLQEIVEIARNLNSKDFSLYMNGFACRKLQRYFKALGSSGIQSGATNPKNGNSVFKVKYGDATLSVNEIMVFDHPALWKSGNVPRSNEIFLVTKDNLDAFIKELIKIENKYQ